MKNKELCITGGTGSLGKALTKALIPLKPKGIRIYSRSELNQFNMKQQFKDSDIPIAYIIGDVRDRDRLTMALKGVDYVVNAAAMKRIEVCDKDPLECLKTNVEGVSNLVYAALRNNVQKVLQVSTDKAVYPTTLYGASKKCAEDLIINANVYSGNKTAYSNALFDLLLKQNKSIVDLLLKQNKSIVDVYKTIIAMQNRATDFMAVRYGNVLGSNGSVLGIFLNQIKNKQKLTVTDPKMTRFWITLPDVCQFIINTLQNHKSGIHVPKMTSSTIGDLIKSLNVIYSNDFINSTFEIERIPSQTNEKKHESLTTVEERERIVYADDRFIINSFVTKDNPAPINWTYTSKNAYSGSNAAVPELVKMIKEVVDDN